MSSEDVELAPHAEWTQLQGRRAVQEIAEGGRRGFDRCRVIIEQPGSMMSQPAGAGDRCVGLAGCQLLPWIIEQPGSAMGRPAGGVHR